MPGFGNNIFYAIMTVETKIKILISSTFRSRLIKNTPNINDQNQNDLYRSVWNTLKQVKFNPDLNGLNFEKLSGPANLYTIRINRNYRLFFTRHFNDDSIIYFFHDFGKHDAYRMIKRRKSGLYVLSQSPPEEVKTAWEINFEPTTEIIEDDKPFPVEREVFNLSEVLTKDSSDPDVGEFFETEIDRFLELSEEQESILSEGLRRKYLRVQGNAGTGKTTALIYFALYLYENCDSDIFIITYNDNLKRVLKHYTHHLRKNAYRHKIRTLTFEEFLETLYRHYIKDEKFNIDHHRNVSMSVIKEIIKDTKLKGTKLEVSELYNLIYTIKMSYYRDDKRNLLKIIGSEEKCKKLFDKLQAKSRVTKIDYDEFKKYYNKYLKTFSHEKTQKKDIADISWKVFEALNTQKSEGKWILLVDEVQDFRPMELELIIKVAQKNSCFNGYDAYLKPQTQIAFFGDENQQIHFSDFLWSEIDKIAIDDDRQIFSLKHNFRNTVQIATVDEPLFKLASYQDTINWIVPKIEGPKPILIIWNTVEDGLKWLRKVFNINNIPIGVGILAESEQAFKGITEILNEEIYFIARSYEGKGLEFDDLIIVDLFAKLRDLNPGDIEKSIRDLWHVSISRARNNLLVCATRDNLEKLQHQIGYDYEQFIEGFNCYDNTAEWEKGFREFLDNCNHTISRLYRILIDLGKSDILWQRFEDSGKDEDKFKAIVAFLKVGRINEIFKKLGEYYFNNPNKLDVVLDLLAIAFLKPWDNQDDETEFSNSNNFNEIAEEFISAFLNHTRLNSDSEKAKHILTYYYNAPYLNLKTGEIYHKKLRIYAQFIYQLCSLQHPFFDVLTFKAFENSISLALPVEDFFELTVTRILIKSEELKDYMRVD